MHKLSKSFFFFPTTGEKKADKQSTQMDLRDKKKKKKKEKHDQAEDVKAVTEAKSSNCLCSPKHRGKYCLGERRRYRICSPAACPPGLPSFRDTQCRHFNAVPYKSRFYQWETIINRGHIQHTSVDTLTEHCVSHTAVTKLLSRPDL